MRPRGGRGKTLSAGGYAQMWSQMSATVRKIRRKLHHICLYQVGQPDPVPLAIRDRIVLHIIVVQELSSVRERRAGGLHANPRHVGVRGVLREPAGRDRHDRAPQNARVPRQREVCASPAARHQGQNVDGAHTFEHGVDAG